MMLDEPDELLCACPQTNASHDARWARERADLERLDAADELFPELLLPGPDDDPFLAPTLLCEVPGALFSVPCPCCLAPLRSCRDDALLARAGLPLYSTTQTILLYCPACSMSDETAPVFYLPLVDPLPDLEPREDVVAPGELVRRLAARLDSMPCLDATATTQEEEAEPASATALSREALSMRLPCASCEHRLQCLGTGTPGAATTTSAPDDQPSASSPSPPTSSQSSPRWIPLIPWDMPYLLTTHSASSLDEMLTSLGSTTPADKRGTRSGHLFAVDSSGMDTVEVLALKLTLFLQIVEAVREHYRLLGLPHLDLCPSAIAVDVDEHGSDHLPHLWRFQARLVRTSGSRLLRLDPSISVTQPPPEPEAPFFAPRIGEHLLAVARPCKLHIDRLVPEPETADVWRLQLRLIDRHGIHPRPAVGAAFEVHWPLDTLGIGARSITACLDDGVSTAMSGGEISLVSTPLSIPPERARRIETVGEARIEDARYRVHQPFGIRDDLYSLGMLLLYILLVNDGNDMMSLRSLLLPDVFSETHPIGVDESGSVDPERLAQRALQSYADQLGPRNVLYHEIDRTEDRPMAIPDQLWQQLITIGFELIGDPGGAADQAEPTLRLDRLMAELETIIRRLHTTLFSRQPLHLEIQSIIAELLAESRSA